MGAVGVFSPEDRVELNPSTRAYRHIEILREGQVICEASKEIVIDVKRLF